MALFPKKPKVLSDQTLRELRELMAAVRAQQGNTNRPDFDDNDYHSPEVYIARTPEGGIPALSTSGTTGTPEAEAEDDVPGWADCDVYRIDQTAADTYGMERVGNDVRVFNLGTAAVDANQFVLVARDKPGRWIITSQAFSASNATNLTVEESDLSVSEPNVTKIVVDSVTMNLTTLAPGEVKMFSLANGITVVDDHTGQTWTGVTTLTLISTPSTYDPDLGDYAYTVLDTGTGSGESGINLGVRLNGRTATMTPFFACIDGFNYYREEAFSNGLWKTEGPLTQSS